MAMAKSSKGAANATTDGKKHKFNVTGSGRIIVGKGVAHASAGKNNAAMAYSNRADQNKRVLKGQEGVERNMIKEVVVPGSDISILDWKTSLKSFNQLAFRGVACAFS